MNISENRAHKRNVMHQSVLIHPTLSKDYNIQCNSCKQFTSSMLCNCRSCNSQTASVVGINPCHAPKVFKFTKVYDALLIHPTSLHFAEWATNCHPLFKMNYNTLCNSCKQFTSSMLCNCRSCNVQTVACASSFDAIL